MEVIPAATLGLAILNLLTFQQFALDKARSQTGGWRVPEARLLGLALLGGSPAALFARRMLRHKSRKQPFSTFLAVIAMVQSGIAMGFLAAVF